MCLDIYQMYEDSKAEGMVEGAELTKINLVNNNYRKHMSPQTIAAFLDCDVDEVNAIINAVHEVGSDYSSEKVYALIKKNQ